MSDILNTQLQDKDAFLLCGWWQSALLESAAAPLLLLPCLPATGLASCLLSEAHDLDHCQHHQGHGAWSWQRFQQPFGMGHAPCTVSKADAYPQSSPTL